MVVVKTCLEIYLNVLYLLQIKKTISAFNMIDSILRLSMASRGKRSMKICRFMR